MGFFCCFSGSSSNKKKIHKDCRENYTPDAQKVVPHSVVVEPKVDPMVEQNPGNFVAQRFTFKELEAATEKFKEEYFLGEGGFGRVYKGRLPSTNEIVAIKRLDRNGCQGEKEFLVETDTLSKGQHDNLVKLIGYCSDGGEMLLVYEYMPLGSLENHLHEPHTPSLDWNTRMKIALDAARGLEYLHNTMKIIYRDVKCANILLGEGYRAKLSDFGLAKVGPTGAATHISTRRMGTDGYCAPEYLITGQLKFKADIYSFGVVLLELITGRRALDPRRGSEQDLVRWARPFLKSKNFMRIVDPMLQGRYPVRFILRSMIIASMCLDSDEARRPEIDEVVIALEHVSINPYRGR